MPDARWGQTNQNVGVWSRERFISGPCKEIGWLMLKNPGLTRGFQGEVFIGKIWSVGYRVCDFLLIAWWWGNRACSKSLVLSLNLPSSTWMGALVPAENLKNIVLYIHPFRRNQDLALSGHCFFLTTPPLFLHSLPSLSSNCLNLLFGTQGRFRRLKPFFLQARNGGHREDLYLGGPHRVLLGFKNILEFSFWSIKGKYWHSLILCLMCIH